MSKFNFTVKADADSIKDPSGAKFIGESGIYDVVIKYASPVTKPSGTVQMNFTVDYEGNEQVFYGLGIFNKDGSENFAAKTFNNLCVLAGIEGQPDTDIQTHKVGKDQKAMDFTVISDLCEFPVKIWVQKTYSKDQNGQIRKDMKVRGFFRDGDGATAAEVASGENLGHQIVKVKEKYAPQVAYQDGLTEDDAKAWEAEKAAERKNNSGSTASATAPAKTPTANPFAK